MANMANLSFGTPASINFRLETESAAAKPVFRVGNKILEMEKFTKNLGWNIGINIQTNKIVTTPLYTYEPVQWCAIYHKSRPTVTSFIYT